MPGVSFVSRFGGTKGKAKRSLVQSLSNKLNW